MKMRKTENLICRELTDRMGGLVDSISTYKSAFYICHPKQQPLKTYFMMKMRKIMWAVCLAALMPISAEAVAATSYDEPQQKENTQKKEIPNPEKTARRRTYIIR